MSEYIPVALKKLVFDRAKGNCEYCRSQAKFAVDPLVMEHIYPLSRGGKTIASNLALACQTCNCKHTKITAPDPATGDRESVMNMRHVLAMMGFYPPDDE